MEEFSLPIKDEYGSNIMIFGDTINTDWNPSNGIHPFIKFVTTNKKLKQAFYNYDNKGKEIFELTTKTFRRQKDQKAPHMIIVYNNPWDDRDITLEELIYTGRHFRTSLAIMTKNPKMPPSIRFNTDYIFVFKYAQHDVIHNFWFSHKINYNEYLDLVKQIGNFPYDSLVLDSRNDKYYLLHYPYNYTPYFFSLIRLKIWIRRFLMKYYSYPNGKGYKKRIIEFDKNQKQQKKNATSL